MRPAGTATDSGFNLLSPRAMASALVKMGIHSTLTSNSQEAAVLPAPLMPARTRLRGMVGLVGLTSGGCEWTDDVTAG
jgi:hypothetical protein